NDVGYGHAVDASLWGDDLPDDLAPGTWDLDIFIAEPAYRGRGIGSVALEMLRDEVFSTTLAIAVSVFPSVENEPAVRAYEKIGFTWKRIWDDPVYGPSWFMVYDRPGA
ncbi:MAG: GNAT family N-acetyltransferase, partial [Hyphomicrobiaceae bacterium]